MNKSLFILFSSISDFFVPGSGTLAESGIHVWAAPLIEAASLKMAIAGGIIGGAATGPV
jgi:hypothetical protein